MAQVPYTGVPTVEPQDIPLRVETPIAAFGGTVARAVEGFGGDISKVGDELWTRAVSLKDLQNRAEADDLQAQYAKQAGEMHANYSMKERRDATDGLLPHYDALEQSRRTIGAASSNPMVQKLYDTESRNVMTRAMNSGAYHAASEGKRYLTDTAKSTILGLHDQAQQYPGDEAGFRDMLDTKLPSLVRQIGVSEGKSEDMIQQDIMHHKSALALSRVNSMARTESVAASKLKDSYIHDGLIIGDDIDRAQKGVDSQLLTAGARQRGVGIVQGRGVQYGSGMITRDVARKAIAGPESSDNYEPPRGPEHPTMGHPLGKYQIMSANLGPWLKEAGMPQMSEQEFIKNHNAQDQLFDFKFGQYLQKYGNLSDAASMWHSGVPYAQAVAEKRADVNISTQEYVRRVNKAAAQQIPLTKLQQFASEQAERDAPGNEMYANQVDHFVIATHTQQQASVRDDNYRLMDASKGILTGLDTPDHKKPTSIDEFRAAPGGDDLWVHADNSHKKYIMDSLDHNMKGDYAFTPESYKLYSTMKGMAYDDDPEVRRAFVETPPEKFMNMPWPFSKREEVIQLQRKLKANSQSDPRVTHALQVLGPDMNGIVDKRSDPDDYYAFVGPLQDQLELWNHAHPGEKIKDEDIRGIGRRLLYQKAELGWFGQQTLGEPAYRMQPSDEEAERIAKLPIWKDPVSGQQMTPTPAWIRRKFLQMQLSPPSEGFDRTKPLPSRQTESSRPITGRLVSAIKKYAAEEEAQQASEAEEQAAGARQVREHRGALEQAAIERQMGILK